MKTTQEEKILEIMAINTSLGGKEWFMPKDFMTNALGDLFVGYEASARLSGLCKKYPFLFETRSNGRFKERKLKVGNIRPFFDSLPFSFQEIVTKYGFMNYTPPL